MVGLVISMAKELLHLNMGACFVADVEYSWLIPRTYSATPRQVFDLVRTLRGVVSCGIYSVYTTSSLHTD